MKAKTVWLIVAAALVISGLLCFSVTMAVNGWNMKSLETVKTEEKEQEISEDFDVIEVESASATIKICRSNDGRARIVLAERENSEITVNVSGKVLSIKESGSENWYQNIGISFTEKTVVLYLPKDTYESLAVTNASGDIEVESGFTFGALSAHTTTGDINVNSSVTGKLTLSATTGDVEIEEITAGEIEISVTTGKVEAESVTATGTAAVSVTTGDAEISGCTFGVFESTGSTGDIELENTVINGDCTVGRSTGDVKLLNFDAENISITTTTGSIKGNITGEKIYITETSVGKAVTPKTLSGGKCLLTTTTGDIIIENGLLSEDS